VCTDAHTTHRCNKRAHTLAGEPCQMKRCVTHIASGLTTSTGAKNEASVILPSCRADATRDYQFFPFYPIQRLLRPPTPTIATINRQNKRIEAASRFRHSMTIGHTPQHTSGLAFGCDWCCLLPSAFCLLVRVRDLYRGIDTDCRW
jgi:hypothetical protein